LFPSAARARAPPCPAREPPPRLSNRTYCREPREACAHSRARARARLSFPFLSFPAFWPLGDFIHSGNNGALFFSIAGNGVENGGSNNYDIKLAPDFFFKAPARAFSDGF